MIKVSRKGITQRITGPKNPTIKAGRVSSIIPRNGIDGKNVAHFAGISAYRTDIHVRMVDNPIESTKIPAKGTTDRRLSLQVYPMTMKIPNAGMINIKSDRGIWMMIREIVMCSQNGWDNAVVIHSSERSEPGRVVRLAFIPLLYAFLMLEPPSKFLAVPCWSSHP